MNDAANESDEELLERYAQGDPYAFEEFFRRHRGRVYQYALQKVLRAELAAEISQDVFLKLHSKIHHYRTNSRALPWFFSIVHNTCIDHIRKRVPESSLQSEVNADEVFELVSSASSHELVRVTVQKDDSSVEKENLTKAIERLPQEQRSVLEGRVIDDKSFAALSLETGKSEVAVRKIYSRAVGKIRSMILGDKVEGGEK
jgi:RNA polymerase sigma-70 factor (ECF subfamily)